MPRTDRRPDPPTLLTLLVSVTRHLPHRWPEFTDRKTVIGAMEAALQSRTELQAVRACYSDPVLRELRLTRLARTFHVPDELLSNLIDRLAALPSPARLPESPELGDWAWERRRDLFGRD